MKSRAVPRLQSIRAFLDESDEPDNEPYETIWKKQDLTLPTLFPYAPTAVSTAWMNALSLCPSFWTRVVIYTDSPSSSSLLRSQLEWSRQLPITITVTMKNPSAFLDSPDEERRRLREIISVTLPHVSRCESLEYSVRYTSSLPRLATDFPDIAPHLRSLTLSALEANGLPGFLDGMQASQYQFPRLKDLKIDGWNFVDLCMGAIWWLEKFLKTKISGGRSLSISHYRVMKDMKHFPRFRINNVLHIVNAVTKLTLENVCFDCTTEDSNDWPEIDNNETLHLRNLTRDLTSMMLYNRLADFIHISHCSLSNVQYLPHCSLTLCDITCPHLSDDLVELLPEWDGCELIIQNCPGFDDKVLKILGSTTRDGSGSETILNSSSIGSLHITDCHGFSAAALVSMVNARNAWIEAEASKAGHHGTVNRFIVYTRNTVISKYERIFK